VLVDFQPQDKVRLEESELYGRISSRRCFVLLDAGSIQDQLETLRFLFRKRNVARGKVTVATNLVHVRETLLRNSTSHVEQ
jgi:hypothetical protein